MEKLAVLAEEKPSVWRDLKKIEMERRLTEERAEEMRIQRKAERDQDARERRERKEVGLHAPLQIIVVIF